MNVNKNQTPIVIGIDHGYGNIKTASSCFRTSVKAYDTEPTFTGNMLVYNGRYIFYNTSRFDCIRHNSSLCCNVIHI